MSEQAKYVERPSLVAIVLCEQVIEDRYSNNKSLIGIFNQILVPSIPSRQPRMFIVGAFTDGRGEIEVALVVRSPSQKEVFKAEGMAEFHDPLAVYDFVFELQDFPILEEGAFDIDFLFDGMPVGHRRFTVRMRKEAGQ